VLGIRGVVVFVLYSEHCAELGIGGVVVFVLYSEHCAELGIGGVVVFVLYIEHCAELGIGGVVGLTSGALLPFPYILVACAVTLPLPLSLFPLSYAVLEIHNFAKNFDKNIEIVQCLLHVSLNERTVRKHDRDIEARPSLNCIRPVLRNLVLHTLFHKVIYIISIDLFTVPITA
jgi:hypothetical protein